jgi:hypothetical protein
MDDSDGWRQELEIVQGAEVHNRKCRQNARYRKCRQAKRALSETSAIKTRDIGNIGKQNARYRKYRQAKRALSELSASKTREIGNVGEQNARSRECRQAKRALSRAGVRGGGGGRQVRWGAVPAGLDPSRPTRGPRALPPSQARIRVARRAPTADAHRACACGAEVVARCAIARNCTAGRLYCARGWCA